MSKPSLARSLWLAGFCITLLVVPLGKAEVREAAGWKCGDWVQDPSGKCEELRVWVDKLGDHFALQIRK